MVTLTNEKPKGTMKLFLMIGLYLYKLKGLAQGLLIMITASATTPVVDVFKKYLLPNTWDNWVVFLILIIGDVCSGIVKHSGLWDKNRKNTLNKDEFFNKLFRKVFVGSMWLALINVILKLNSSNDYFDDFGISVLISWLGWSIASNLYVISGSTFPPKWIMRKLKKANEGEEEPDKNQ